VETLKEIASTIGAVVGLISALAPVCAYFLGKKKKRPRKRRRVAAAPPAVAPPPPAAPPPRVVPVARAEVPITVRPIPVLQPVEEVEYEEPAVSQAAYEHARRKVRVPAIIMLTVGCLGLLGNLSLAVFGYVDEFVTPLGTSSKQRHEEAARAAEERTPEGKKEGISHRTAAVMAIIMLVSCAFASAVSIWASINMLRLENYWLAVAGSLAVMPAGCCCVLGLPSGIWSLVFLFQEDVRSAFQ
jgi:hypothetical protein